MCTFCLPEVYNADSYRHSLERDFDEQEVVLYEITDNDIDTRPTR